MGSGKGGKTDWQMVAGQNAYNAASQGQSLDDILASAPEYAGAMTQGYNMWKADKAQQDMFMNMFAPGQADTGPDSADAGDPLGYFDESNEFKWTVSGDPGYSKENFLLYASPEDIEKAGLSPEGFSTEDTQGLNNRDSAYTSYYDAADKATSHVNGLISEERSNAALLGIDYNITDEQKSTRINSYFSDIWSQSNQDSLDQLTLDFGAPEGFEGFSVTRNTGADTGLGT